VARWLVPERYWMTVIAGALGLMIVGVVALADLQDQTQPSRRLPTTVTTLAVTTRAGSYELRQCLTEWRVHGLWLGGSSRRRSFSGTWRKLSGFPGVYRAENTARQLQVDVIDFGSNRQIRVSKSQGRPLRASERAVVEECISRTAG
jgi:hypothetical protein